MWTNYTGDNGSSHVTFMLSCHSMQACYLRQIVLSGLGDHVARRIPTDGMNAEDRKRLRNAYQVCHARHIHLCRLTLGVAMLKVH